jgi:putative phosphoesterase
VGLISDTHGLLRPEAMAMLEGSDFIVHAGDICEPSILAELSTIAPVTAVRGNNDRGPWAARLCETERLDVGGVRIFVVHDIATCGLDPAKNSFDVVVSGHSHRPQCERRGGVLYVNPGSAGPRRFRLPVSMGTLAIDAGRVSVELFSLDVEHRQASHAAAGHRVET